MVTACRRGLCWPERPEGGVRIKWAKHGWQREWQTQRPQDQEDGELPEGLGAGTHRGRGHEGAELAWALKAKEIVGGTLS